MAKDKRTRARRNRTRIPKERLVAAMLATPPKPLPRGEPHVVEDPRIGWILSEFCLRREDYTRLTLVEQGAGYEPVLVCIAENDYNIRVLAQRGADHIVLSDRDSDLWSSFLARIPGQVKRSGEETFYIERDSFDIQGVLAATYNANMNDWTFYKKGTPFERRIKGNAWMTEVGLAMMHPDRRKHYEERIAAREEA